MNGAVNKFGIEIETVGLNKAAIANAIQTVVGGTVTTSYDGASVTMADGRIWNVVRDGSLSGFDNGEIVSPILTTADMDNLQAIVRAVRNAGARVDASCGIHVHVDGSQFTARTLTNLVTLVDRREKMFHRAFGVAAHRADRYAKLVSRDFVARLESSKPTTLAGVQSAWYGAFGSPHRYHESRYHGLNLNSFFYRGTVEFRYFNGTLHAGEVKTYVQFVLALANAAIKKKSAAKTRRTPVTDEGKAIRAFMANIGMGGEAYKTARFHMTKRFKAEAVAVAA